MSLFVHRLDVLKGKNRVFDNSGDLLEPVGLRIEVFKRRNCKVWLQQLDKRDIVLQRDSLPAVVDREFTVGLLKATQLGKALLV